MARLGTFDTQLEPRAWFDDNALPEGWFVADLIPAPASNAFTLVADGGTYSYSGNDATLTYTPAGAFTLTADGGAYSYSGNNATLIYTPSGAFVLQADGGSYTYAGDNANLLYSGTPVVPESRGGYGEKRKRKQRDFDEERRERERLREAIVAAVSPIKATKAEVVSTAAEGEEGVAILTRKSKVAILVPASFDAAEVARMVAAALEAAGIEARRVETERARRQALAAFEAERVRRMQKRRREEWLLLLS